MYKSWLTVDIIKLRCNLAKMHYPVTQVSVDTVNYLTTCQIHLKPVFIYFWSHSPEMYPTVVYYIVEVFLSLRGCSSIGRQTVDTPHTALLDGSVVVLKQRSMYRLVQYSYERKHSMYPGVSVQWISPLEVLILYCHHLYSLLIVIH